MIIVITIITKGISDDKPSSVKALEAKEPADTFKGCVAFCYLRAIQYLSGW